MTDNCNYVTGSSPAKPDTNLTTSTIIIDVAHDTTTRICYDD